MRRERQGIRARLLCELHSTRSVRKLGSPTLLHAFHRLSNVARAMPSYTRGKFVVTDWPASVVFALEGHLVLAHTTP